MSYQETYDDYGINVKIIGEQIDVVRVIQALSANPPKKFLQIKNQYVHVCRNTENDIVMTYNKKKYSGSGLLVILLDENKVPHVALFKSVSNGLYEDLGGHLETCSQQVDPSTILLENALREAFEESIKLFGSYSHSAAKFKYIDIESQDTGNWYSSHVLLINLDNYTITNLPKYFHENRTSLYNDAATTPIPEYYREMSDCAIFKLSDLTDKINELTPILGGLSKASVKTTDGTFVEVRMRALKIIQQLGDINQYAPVVGTYTKVGNYHTIAL